MMRDCVRRVLLDFDDLDIVEEVEDGLEAVRAAHVRQPDLFVLDLSMPYARGIEVFIEIRRQSPNTRVAVLTGVSSSGLLSELIASGVDGLFLKRGAPEVLSQGLSLVLDGGKFISPDVVEILSERPAPPALTDRERQTLSFIAQGYTNAEIGHRLDISAKTVEKHRGSLMSKLGVNSMAQLLAHALREGLLDAAID
jgi:DNA-binding NarL/FixJ family response regulator